MSGPWLYPISKNVNTYFQLTGETVNVSAENFNRLVNNGRITEDVWWFVKQNWRYIHAGDDVYIYTGDEDQGIIGYAKVVTVAPFPDAAPPGWYICLDFDLEKCQRLLRQPIPARTVRDKWVHYPRKTVINLQGYEQEIESLLPWKIKAKK